MANWLRKAAPRKHLAQGSMLLAAVCSSALMASPALADTLEEALRRAHANNPSVELARAIVRANDELVTQARAAYGPSIELNASHRFTSVRTELPGASTGGAPLVIANDGFASSGSVTLAQPLFTSGRLAAGLDLATAQAQASRQQLRDESLQLMLDVIGAYLSLQRDLELYEVAAQTYSLLQTQSDLTRQRLELRNATAPDVDQTVNRAELAAGRLIIARANLEATAAAYRNLVGAYPSQLAPPPPLPPLPPLAEIYELAESYNPELQAAKFTELASRAQVAGARAARGPQINADALYGRLPTSQFDNETHNEQVAAGVSFSMPLYAGGALSARVREAQQRNFAAQHAVEQARRDVREDIASDWALLRAAEEALPRLEAAVAAAQRAVDGVQQQQIAGLRTLRDVLEVTNDLFIARSDLVRGRAEIYFRHAALLRHAGILSIDMFVPGAGYDPDAYRPGEAGLAGLPLEPLLHPLDTLLQNSRVRDAGSVREADPAYGQMQQLDNPLRPLRP